jgi:hypothetical protein
MPIYTKGMPCWQDLQVWQAVRNVGGFGPGDKMIDNVQWVDTDHGMCRVADVLEKAPHDRTSKVVGFKTLRGKFRVRSLYNGTENPSLDDLKALDAEKRLRGRQPLSDHYDGGP